LTLDSTLDELIDQPEAYALVMKIIAEHNAEFADRINGQMDLTLHQAAYLNPRAEDLSNKIGAVLASLRR
jgi:hypothetical protein